MLIFHNSPASFGDEEIGESSLEMDGVRKVEVIIPSLHNTPGSLGDEGI